jgi:hypothetical protein
LRWVVTACLTAETKSMNLTQITIRLNIIIMACLLSIKLYLLSADNNYIAKAMPALPIIAVCRV